MYKNYMEMSPKDGRDDMFYLQPLQREHQNICYSRHPTGANILATFTREIGFIGYYTTAKLK